MKIINDLQKTKNFICFVCLVTKKHYCSLFFKIQVTKELFINFLKPIIVKSINIIGLIIYISKMFKNCV